MAEERNVAGPAHGRWWWRGVAVAGAAVLAVSVTLVLVWFFSDPQPDSQAWLETLSWRAGVVGMFAGVVLGVAALVVSVLALRAQQRVEGPSAPTVPSGSMAPALPAPVSKEQTTGGHNSGTVFSGDGPSQNITASAQGATAQGAIYGNVINHASDSRPDTDAGRD